MTTRKRKAPKRIWASVVDGRAMGVYDTKNDAIKRSYYLASIHSYELKEKP